jgi:hypothetical protein
VTFGCELRPGWKARNHDTDRGRVYDLENQPNATVDWDWDGYVTGYVGGRVVYDERANARGAVRAAMRAVEDVLARQGDAA